MAHFSHDTRLGFRRSSAPVGWVKKWLAILLLTVAAGSTAWLLSRDVDWEIRRHESYLRGLTAEHNRDYNAARGHYETALRSNPYDWRAHQSLAYLLLHRMNEPEKALNHFFRVQAYVPEPELAADVDKMVALLLMVRAGELEHPSDAMEDMFDAIEENSQVVFYYRLSPILRPFFREYWRAWRDRGRGRVSFQEIRLDGDEYSAIVEIEYEDSVHMLMRLVGDKFKPWLLDLSFP